MKARRNFFCLPGMDGHKKSNASWVFVPASGLNSMEPEKTNGLLPMTTVPHNGTPLPLHNKMDQSVIKKPQQQNCLRQNLLTILTFGAVLAGIGLGFGLREARVWTKREIMYVNFPGEIFLRMLRCLILPLIVSSLVSALGGLDTKLSGRIGLRAVVYYMSTTVIAIVLGIILVVSIRPGSFGEEGKTENSNSTKPDTRPMLTEDTLMDLLRNMFPPNIIEACTHQYSTSITPPQGEDVTNSTTDDYKKWSIGSKMGGGTNILGLVVFSVVMGITLGRMKKAGKPLLDVFTALSDAMMIITKMVIWLSPVGVLFLVAGKVLEMEDLKVIAGQVGMYTVTVLVGLLVHGFIILPLIYFVIVRKEPFGYMINMAQALATAFGTSSSSATLPVTISCLEEKNRVDPRVSRFCLPVGATINMDGTALYEAVAAIFIAQVRRVPLSLGSIVAISITATAASIGAAGIPQAGLVTMVMVLNVVGLPADDVALIFVVDWLLDRFRTAINVLGDAYGSGIVAHMSVNDLAELTTEQTTLETTSL